MRRAGPREVNRFSDIVNNEEKPQVRRAAEMERGQEERVKEEEGGEERGHRL